MSSSTKGLPTILEGTIREIARQEVKNLLAEMSPAKDQAPTGARWLTPPQAARMTGISVKAIRNMIQEGVIQRRLRNISRRPTQAKYLVNVDEVTAVAASSRVASERSDLTVQELARRILSDRDSRERSRDAVLDAPAPGNTQANDGN